MIYDAARAMTLLTPYRYITLSDATVLAKSDNAKEIVWETGLDEAGATALANSLASRFSGFDKAVMFTRDDLVYIDDLVTQPDRYIPNFSRHPNVNGLTYQTSIVEIDLNTEQTRVTVTR